VTLVSAVVASSNTRECLRQTLLALRRALPGSSEVIVVDNASRDGTARLVAEEFPHVRLVRLQRNVGYARAVNQGFEMARGAYVLLLEADACVEATAVKQMIAFLEQNLRYGAVVPRLVGADGRTLRSHMRLPSAWTPFVSGTPLERWFPNAVELVRYHARDFDYERTGDVEQPSSACMLMRRKALRSEKLLDTTMGLFYGDVDLCKRFAQRGWRIGYLASAHALHTGVTHTRECEDFVAEYQENRLSYYKKHHGRLAGAWVKTCVALWLVDRCVRELYHRAEGMPEEPILPLVTSFAGFVRR
jgi:GT2 family glycosyltransferase